MKTGLKSPLPGVSNEAWVRFVSALEVQPIRAVSDSGGLGAYDMRPRRLQELGLARVGKLTRSVRGRFKNECEFVPPLTQSQFLNDPVAQYRALVLSITSYHRDLTSGKLRKPEEMSLAGALAILHRGMRGALRSWPELFSETRALHDRARGAF